jgi:DNA-binding MarR family transcriptional regulator
MEFPQADALNGAIRTICIRHRAYAAARLATLGLHPGHEAVLLLLDAHGPQTQKELAAGAGCEPPSITVMVRKLEAAGLISRRPATQDARAVVVELTDKGHQTIPALKSLWQDLADQTVADLGSTSIEQLIATLTDLARSLQAADATARRAAGIHR